MNLSNIKKFDYKKIIVIIKNNFDKDAGLFTVIFCLIVFFGLRQFLIPSFTQLNKNFTNLSQKQQEFQQYSERSKLLATPAAQEPKQNLPIKIYQAPYPEMDTESACTELVQEVIKIIKNAGNNKINQIDFTTQDMKDASGAKSNDYGILTLNLSIDGSYKSIRNMLNDLYLMNYLTVIKKLNSKPSEDDNITTNITLDLYVKLSDSSNDNNNSKTPILKFRQMQKMHQLGNNGAGAT